MLACTFFGHRDCPASVRCRLHQVLTELIERRGVTVFYVGNQGRFDAMAYAVLNELKATHPEVICRIVLAYMPRKPADGGPDTLLPDGHGGPDAGGDVVGHELLDRHFRIQLCVQG